MGGFKVVFFSGNMQLYAACNNEVCKWVRFVKLFKDYEVVGGGLQIGVDRSLY
jgi:hypothetical protein